MEPPPQTKFLFHGWKRNGWHYNATYTPHGCTISVVIPPFPITDSDPNEKEVAWVVLCLCLNRSGILSSMRAEDICAWVQAAKRNHIQDPANWGKVVSIIKVAFWDRTLAEKCAWKTVVLTPKGRRECRGIFLVKVLWRSVAGILNWSIILVIVFHETLHGFRAGRGTGTTSPEADVILQLSEMRETVLYEILLDIQKASDVLDRDQ